MSAAIRLEDLQRSYKCDACHVGDIHWATPTPSEVASVLSDADLLGELVRRGVAYTFRCAACELDGCHEGVNGEHDGPNNPAVHTRDVWLLSGMTETELEAMEEEGRQALGEPS